MNGLLTCVVLGAGASRNYKSSRNVQMPLQADLLGNLFVTLSSNGVGTLGAFDFGGLQHSERLADFLRSHFLLSAKTDDKWMEYWTELQQRFTLETLYRELERLVTTDEQWVLDEFEAIVRTRVTTPVDRSGSGLCDLHTTLIRSLEPGDWIVDFNWDTIASDALYHLSRLWHPSSGFGIGYHVNVISNEAQDWQPVSSQVSLFHLHGCVSLYEAIVEDRVRGFAYVAPETYDSGSSLIQNLRMSDTELRHAPPEEMDRYRLGWVKLPNNGPWLRPIFIPPSSRKVEYSSRYVRMLMMRIHRDLPVTQRFVVIGYSVPPADHDHLSRFFVQDVIRETNAELSIVNPEVTSSHYIERVMAWLPTKKTPRLFESLVDFVADEQKRSLNRTFISAGSDRK